MLTFLNSLDQSRSWFSKESNVTPKGSHLVRYPFLIALPLSTHVLVSKSLCTSPFVAISSNSVSRRSAASNHAKTPRITLNRPEAVGVSNTCNSYTVKLDYFKPLIGHVKIGETSTKSPTGNSHLMYILDFKSIFYFLSVSLSMQ